MKIASTKMKIKQKRHDATTEFTFPLTRHLMKDTFIKWAIDKDFCFLSDFDKTGYSYKDTWLGNTTSLNFTKIRQKTKTKCFIKPISQMGRYVFC